MKLGVTFLTERDQTGDHCREQYFKNFDLPWLLLHVTSIKVTKLVSHIYIYENYYIVEPNCHLFQRKLIISTHIVGMNPRLFRSEGELADWLLRLILSSAMENIAYWNTRSSPSFYMSLTEAEMRAETGKSGYT